tara:strand:- start:265 stop:1761 length:1497 start_codon:yes stop_codon:yes gene_type:complete
MKLNELNFDLLSDKELIMICLKYKMIEKKDLPNRTRKEILELIKTFLQKKLSVYGQKKEEKDIKSVQIQRRMSTTGRLQKDSKQSIPRPIVKRRMSHPITKIEKIDADNTIQRNEINRVAEKEVKHEIKSTHPQYDKVGVYPAVKRLVAIGDVHGDLRATLIALKLAEVIPQQSNERDLNSIHWCGGSTWVVQLGDQIDRCRPDELVKNCIKDFSDVFQDEGNNMKIIKLFLRLDDEARKVGGRVLGLLGNHELMNIDKDFRYVSPLEFLEFVPEKDRTSKYTKDGYPLGYYHRTKAFQRGGSIAKMYASRKKSILMVGNFIFVHGGLTRDLMKKYKISEINSVVSKWMTKESNAVEDDIFDEIFRDDDDMSPFWCRVYGEEDEENTENTFNELLKIINQKNKLLMPVKGMVIAHTPQFMENKYLNSIYNNRLWRVDVGMSRAFGEHNACKEDKYRQIQILIIHENQKFEVRKKPFNSERHPTTGMGGNVNLQNERMY